MAILTDAIVDPHAIGFFQDMAKKECNEIGAPLDGHTFHLSNGQRVANDCIPSIEGTGSSSCYGQLLGLYFGNDDCVIVLVIITNSNSIISIIIVFVGIVITIDDQSHVITVAFVFLD